MASAARLGVVWFALAKMPRGWLWTRGTEMGFLATAVLRGHGLSDPYGVSTGPSTAVGPGYPLLLATIFRWFGVETVSAAAMLLGVQVVVSLLTIGVMLRLARRFAREGLAVGLVLLWSLSPATMWIPAILWDTCLSALFLVIGLAWALEAEDAARGSWLGYGAGCAVAGLVNPSLLPSLLGLGAVAAWRGGRWREAAMAFAMFAGLYAPWPVRNARVFHATILTRSVAGYNLWVGNRAGAEGYSEEALFPTVNAGELAEYRARGEVGYDAEKMRLTKEAIRTHPGRFVRLTMVRAWRFWSGTGTAHAPVWFGLHGAATMLLGGAGMWVLVKRQRREAAYFLMVLTVFPLPYWLTHADFRYRLVIDPVVAVLGVVWLNEVIGGRRSAASGTAMSLPVGEDADARRVTP